MSDKYTLRKLFHDQKTLCHYCKEPMTLSHGRLRATIDHKLPKSRGGGDEAENLVAACITCNGLKANLTEEEFLLRMEAHPEWRRKRRRRRENRMERRVRMLSMAIRQQRVWARH